MKLDENYLAKIEFEIDKNVDDMFTDSAKLDKVARLMSIHANLIVEQTYKQQLAVLKQSQEMAKNIDFSKLDLNQLLNGLRGG